MSSVEEKAQELAKTIADLRKAKEDNDGKIANLEQAKATMESQLKAIQQARDAESRAAVERAANGPESELDLYVARSAPSAQDVGNYRSTADGSIRLTGHTVKHIDREGQVHEVWVPGLLDDTKPKTKSQLALQRAVTRRSIARQAMKAGKRFTPALDAEVLEAARQVGGPVFQKILADSAGIGASWVPDVTIPEIEREIMIPTGLPALFKRRILNVASVTMPRIAGRVRFYIHRVPTQNDPAADPLSNLTDSSVSIDTVSSAGGVQFDRDWAEDAILAVLPEIQSAIVDGWRWAEDDTIMNGHNTQGAHQDAIASWDPRGMLGGTAGLGTSIDHRRRWDGLRRRGKAAEAVTGFGATDQGAAQTFAGLKAALKNLGVANMISAQGNSNVVAITSWEYFFGTMLDFAEFASWEKVGALAAILSGQLGDLGATPGGILPGQVGFVSGMVPVLISGAMTADLAATGLYTGSGSTTGMVVVDRSRFEYVIRKSLTFDQEVDIRNNTTTVVARGRTNFRPLDAIPVAADGVRDVHYSYNLTA